MADRIASVGRRRRSKERQNSLSANSLLVMEPNKGIVEVKLKPLSRLKQRVVWGYRMETWKRKSIVLFVLASWFSLFAVLMNLTTSIFSDLTVILTFMLMFSFALFGSFIIWKYRDRYDIEDVKVHLEERIESFMDRILLAVTSPIL